VKPLALLLAAALGVGCSTAFAATLSVGSWHLWAGAQTLTKGTCTVTASTDTYVDENKPANSFGMATTMSVKPDSAKRQWAFVRFDLSSCNIPTSGGADSATLNLRVTTSPTQSRQLTATPVLTTWADTLTWNGAQALSYGSATTSFSTGTTNNVTVAATVTVDVDALIKDGSANFGWRISDSGSQATGDTTTIASANAPSNKPQLVINYEK
jgi:hypothetical protein